MSDSNKTYRIRTAVQGDEYVNLDVNLVQDIDIFEILSLKVSSENLYRLHTANYGCLVGRVLANNSVGIPNVRISIFIAADEETRADEVLSYLYPYNTVRDTNEDGIRYNLLTDEKLTECHQAIGTFPVKRLVLDDNNVFEIFDKYYKFTTTTNFAGDYMIFGIPTGNQQLHMEFDISDIGDLLSQKPRDLIYKGYNVNQFDSSSMFKKETNLDTLSQVFTENATVFIHPFWGEVEEMGETDTEGVRISRKDINVNYKFEPTCVFMGSLITDEKSNGFSKRCIPTTRMGKMDRLTTGEGTIEMIRKTPEGDVESFTIMGNQLIDGDGTWCYQIPMNLDYVRSDEYGNIVPTDDPNIGVPTRARVRFRVSLSDPSSDQERNHLTKMLIPNNPQNQEEAGTTYVFGTLTPESEFRDLFWNKVYTVKSHIPRLGKSNLNRDNRFSGIKAVNVNVGNNPVPYNNMRINITFLFVLQCAIMHTLIWITKQVNRLIVLYAQFVDKVTYYTDDSYTNNIRCLTVGDGACPELENWYFAPGCQLKTGKVQLMKNTVAGILDKEGRQDPYSIGKQNEEEEGICLTDRIDYFIQCIEISLAQEYEVIQFDFYNDWINGVTYIPRWFANVKKKRTFFFGLVRRKAYVQACLEESYNKMRKYTQQCALEYVSDNGLFTKVSMEPGCTKKKQKCHKAAGRNYIKVRGGYVHRQNTIKNESAYYFKPCDFTSDGKKINYFATDLVLLGSLSERDMDGIPQTFKNLASSSYQMPDNLASTNIDASSIMLGNQGNEYCSTSKNVSKFKQVKKTTVDPNNGFKDVENWITNNKIEGGYDDDATEIPVTESAGIDWGFTGPGQEFTGSTKGIYKPGGHFLGISCFYSESNIKSCVNLSRICEFGVSTSDLQDIPRAQNNNVVFDSFTVPTGFISGDEIIDGTFREEFATLNYNRLETVIDRKTGRRVYNLTSLKPVNFDGSLSTFVDGGDYNELNGQAVKSNNGIVQRRYKRTIESPNKDYYYFRLGFHDVYNTDAKRMEALRQKYLIDYGTRVSMPVYENSYYFYFGLHDGATAIDRFRKEYFAECPVSDDTNAIIRIETTGVDVCTGGSSGKATVHLYNFPLYAVEYEVTNEAGVTVREGMPGNSDVFEIDGLTIGNYSITVKDQGITPVSTTFAISELLSKSVASIRFDFHPFENEVQYTDEDIANGLCKTEGNGYVTFSLDEDVDYSNVRVKIVGPNHFYYANIGAGDKPNASSENGYINPSNMISGEKHYLWEGNAQYSIVVELTCGTGGEYEFSLGSKYVDMPQRFDIVFGEVPSSTYRKTLVRAYGNSLDLNNWWKDALSASDSLVSPLEKWGIERAITFKSVLGNYGSIDIECDYGTMPYTQLLSGNPETYEDESVIAEIGNYQGGLSGTTYSMFKSPTVNVPSGYFNRAKEHYRLIAYDAEGDTIPEDGGLKLPSVYHPFFARGIVYRNMTKGQNSWHVKAAVAIVNGNPYEGYFEDVKFNGKTFMYSPRKEQQAWWNFSGGMFIVTTGKSQTYEFSQVINNSRKYEIVIKESEPEGYEIADEISLYRVVKMPGDGVINADMTRYFKLYRVSANGNRVSGTDIDSYLNTFENLEILPFKGTSLVHDDQALAYYSSGNQIYWVGSCNRAFMIEAGDGGYFMFTPENEISREKISRGDSSDILNPGVDEFIIGICDPWTMLSNENYASAQYNTEAKYENVPEFGNSLAIITIYTATQFKKFIDEGYLWKNDEGGDTGGGESGGGEGEIGYYSGAGTVIQIPYFSEAFTVTEHGVDEPNTEIHEFYYNTDYFEVGTDELVYISQLQFRLGFGGPGFYEIYVRLVDSNDNIAYDRGGNKCERVLEQDEYVGNHQIFFEEIEYDNLVSGVYKLQIYGRYGKDDYAGNEINHVESYPLNITFVGGEVSVLKKMESSGSRPNKSRASNYGYTQDEIQEEMENDAYNGTPSSSNAPSAGGGGGSSSSAPITSGVGGDYSGLEGEYVFLDRDRMDFYQGYAHVGDSIKLDYVEDGEVKRFKPAEYEFVITDESGNPISNEVDATNYEGPSWLRMHTKGVYSDVPDEETIADYSVEIVNTSIHNWRDNFHINYNGHALKDFDIPYGS